MMQVLCICNSVFINHQKIKFIRLIVDTFYLVSHMVHCVLFPAEPLCERLQFQGKCSVQELYIHILPISVLLSVHCIR
jgi:hypothetical protein